MSTVSFSGDDIEIAADVVAAAFGLDTAALREAMRAGTITSRAERGEGEDAGRWRLSFFSTNRRVRFTCDTGGAVISTDTIDFADRPLPPGLRAQVRG